MNFLKHFILALPLIFTMTAVFAAESQPQQIPSYSMQEYDAVITKLYLTPEMHSLDRKKRLRTASQLFLNQPYLLGPLGEGPKAVFDQQPLYRTDVFDCMTYVSTILALANANNLAEFQQAMRRINYQDNEVNYIKRNHFTSLDWNINNANHGYIRDITTHIFDRQGHPVAKQTSVLIDKKDWYKKKNIQSIVHIEPLQPQKAAALLKQLHHASVHVKNQTVVLSYIPLTLLFDTQGNPNLFLFDQIPNASIVELVTPYWDRRRDLGSFIDIAHLGFVFRTKQGLIFRDASELHGKVKDHSLIAYLRHFINSPTIKGINIQDLK